MFKSIINSNKNGNFMTKKLTFNSNPKRFPDVWYADEPATKIKVSVNGENFETEINTNINEVINKHVYLSMFDPKNEVSLYHSRNGKDFDIEFKCGEERRDFSFIKAIKDFAANCRDNYEEDDIQKIKMVFQKAAKIINKI